MRPCVLGALVILTLGCGIGTTPRSRLPETVVVFRELVTDADRYVILNTVRMLERADFTQSEIDCAVAEMIVDVAEDGSLDGSDEFNACFSGGPDTPIPTFH